MKITLPIGGVAAVGTTAVVASMHFLNMPAQDPTIKNPNPKAILIATSSVTKAANPTQSVEGNLENYKCRFQKADSNTDTGVDCVVQAFVVTDDTKKQESFEKVKEFTSSFTPVTLQSLKTSTSVFKVQVPASLLSSVPTDNAKLEIISDSEPTNVIQELDFLFAVNTSSSDALVGKSQYYVAKAITFTSATTPTSTPAPTSTPKPTTGQEFKCSLSDNFSTPTPISCQVFQFDSSDDATSALANASTLNFNATTTAADTISQHKWYLIKYTSPQSLTDSVPTDIYAHKVTTSSNTVVTTGEKTVKFEKAIPVALTSETSLRVMFLKAHNS